MVSAVQLAQGKQQFTDASGVPLNGGTVAFFVPGTSTPSNTWQDSGLTTLNTNPVTLDSAGRAIIFGQGNYRQLVKDSLGNTIWDQVVVTPLSQVDAQNGVPQWGGTSSGAANVYNVTVAAPAPTAYVAGQSFEFFTHQANTDAAVFNANGLGAKAITKKGATALVSGDIGNAQVIRVTLDPNLNAELTTPPGSLLTATGAGLQVSGPIASVDPSFFGGIGTPPPVLSNVNVTTVGISASAVVSDDNTTLIKLASAFTKTTAAWAVGTGNGALDTGSVANSSLYYVYLIERTDTGVVDVLFSLSATAPTMPANYTKKRGSAYFSTDGTASVKTITWPVRVITSGSGTYTTPPGVIRLKVRMAGGGGGGAGAGSGGTAGTAGGSTTFGSLTATGGAARHGAAGTGSGGDLNISGAQGGAVGNSTGRGAQGGGTPFEQGGAGGEEGGVGLAAVANTGAGGGGGGGSSQPSEGAGSGGGYVEKLFIAPAASFSFAVGAGGSGGSGGTGGGAGGAGAAGVIVIEELYN